MGLFVNDGKTKHVMSLGRTNTTRRLNQNVAMGNIISRWLRTLSTSAMQKHSKQYQQSDQVQNYSCQSPFFGANSVIEPFLERSSWLYIRLLPPSYFTQQRRGYCRSKVSAKLLLSIADFWAQLSTRTLYRKIKLLCYFTKQSSGYCRKRISIQMDGIYLSLWDNATLGWRTSTNFTCETGDSQKRQGQRQMERDAG